MTDEMMKYAADDALVAIHLLDRVFSPEYDQRANDDLEKVIRLDCELCNRVFNHAIELNEHRESKQHKAKVDMVAQAAQKSKGPILSVATLPSREAGQDAAGTAAERSDNEISSDRRKSPASQGRRTPSSKRHTNHTTSSNRHHKASPSNSGRRNPTSNGRRTPPDAVRHNLPVCRNWARSGSCSFADRCKFSHS